MAGEPFINDASTRARDRIGRYRLLAPLGEGGMGVVHLAEDTALRRRVALKLLTPALADSPTFRDRFVRESRLAASIDHPGIIPVYEAGEEDGVLFIAMRFVEGGDMRQLLASEGPLDPSRAVGLAGQVAAALDAAHAVALVHRDVKPANVMVERAHGAEHCYLTDFGLTKNLSASSGYTSTGQFVGTLSYVAPEQIQGGPITARADVYALGCVLFEALTGSVPFQRDSDVALMYAHMNEPPPSACARRPGLPAGIDQVLAQAMAKAPEDRHGSCVALTMAANAALAGVPVPAFLPTRRAGRRFARIDRQAPEPTAPAPARPAPRPRPAILQPATPVPVPAPAERSPLRAAAIVAIAILLCAGGIAAALVLSNRDGSGSADQADARLQGVLRHTVALDNRLTDLADRLQRANADAAALRRRLAREEKAAERLAAEARAQREATARIRTSLVQANVELARASRRLRAYAGGGHTDDLQGGVTILQTATGHVHDVTTQLNMHAAGGRGMRPVDLASLPMQHIRLPSGVSISGAPTQIIQSAVGVGDVDGDGLEDIAIGYDTVDSPSVAVIFGSRDAGAHIDLDDLGDAGFTIEGVESPQPAGDVDGDRRDDIAALAFQNDGSAPTAYVIHGKRSTRDVVPEAGSARVAAITLPGGDGIDVEDGFSLAGATAAGDVNADGHGDLLIGDPGNGTAWVVYGGPTLDAGVSLDDLTGAAGFSITSDRSDAGVGGIRARAGDLNGDGIDDVVVGAPYAEGNRGAAYVVLGSREGGDVNVGQPGDWGFRIQGAKRQDHAGASLAGLGDFDGDGHDDLVVGAPGASPHGRQQAGAAYIVRGADGGGDLDLGAGGPRVVEIDGPAPADPSLTETSGSIGVQAVDGGDMNGDGRPDAVLGAGGLVAPAAVAYVVYGRAAPGTATIDLRSPGGQATAIDADHDPANGAFSVGAGDFNGDKRPDFLGVLGAGPGGEADVVSIGG